MELVELKQKLRTNAGLAEANAIESNSYRSAFDRLSPADKAEITKQVQKLQNNLKSINEHAKLGDASALELLANIAPFMEGWNE